MDAGIMALKALFQKDVRYVIPTFQRPYVWNQEDQWEPLWDDVRNTAEQYLEELAKIDGNPALAEERTGAHFMGAVVLQQQANATAELETRHVIDGQQRMTTLQLLLDAAQEVFEQDGHEREAKQLRRLVMNDEDYAETDGDHIFKIWPTLTDRDAFRSAMDNNLAVEAFADAPIVQAHEFFKLQIRQWLASHQNTLEPHSQALVTTLLGLLQLVVIDLTTQDDANVIFETLNARGTPLLASDLIKNSILHSASESGLDSDSVYQRYWEGFDQAWWREDIRQGRIVRPRIDVYLNYWLTMRTAAEVQSADVFSRFRQYASELGPPITGLVEDINATASAYKELDSIDDNSARGIFLYRWRVMDAGVTTPVILWLFANARRFSSDHVEKALGAIESYLLRRMVCRLTTKGYNRLFLDLLEALTREPNKPCDEVVTNFFAAQSAESAYWPTDAQMEEAFVSLPLYQLLTRRRLRMVLEGLEDERRSPKTEEAHVTRGSLTIEHVMPQGWRHHWPLSPDAPSDAAQVRDRVVQTVGNLTLLNDRLNPSLSNGPWTSNEGASKRTGLNASVLLLNKELVASAPEIWDEQLIRSRAVQMALAATKVWPRPDTETR